MKEDKHQLPLSEGYWLVQNVHKGLLCIFVQLQGRFCYSIILSFFSGPAKYLVPHHFIPICPVAVGFVISFLVFLSLFSINGALYSSFGNRMKKIAFITMFLSISICFASFDYSCSFVMVLEPGYPSRILFFCPFVLFLPLLWFFIINSGRKRYSIIR